ncbi:MAG: hypothetical protein M1834_001516 [Cirrosporium novae-zelandiae]|nr:MAG: hypothetical protein M1834_004033 [Cirrosporium novae-zelandiae]KAI9735501.1 MAG: hypothetical protein M1834_001516 [Cirrosporium novae-zelandiae]
MSDLSNASVSKQRVQGSPLEDSSFDSADFVHSDSASTSPEIIDEEEFHPNPVAVEDDNEGYEMREISGSSKKGYYGLDGSDSDSDDEDETDEHEPIKRRRTGSSAQSFELYTPDEERAVVRKFDTRLVLFMAFLYMLSFLDRSNIGNARLAGLQNDLQMTTSQFEWILSAFYITYVIFEWMTLLYSLVPPHIYISICVLSWGLIASLQAVATSFGPIVFLRALLGISEAAFGPGVPFYLSFFFRRDELALRTGLFISAAPLASSFAGVLAWVITKLSFQGPIAPWRVLFLVEGFPSVLVAVWAWKILPDRPEKAKYLTSRESRVARLRLRRENGERKDIRARRESSWREIKKTLLDPKCYFTAMMFFCSNVAFSSMPVFLPTIISEMGYSRLLAQLLSAPPYLFSFIAVITTSYLSDRYKSRTPYVVFHALVSSVAYTFLALGHTLSIPPTARYILLYPAAAGFFCAVTIIITWTDNVDR